MRPRVFPAEDMKNFAGADGAYEASMRPRVFPAEDAPRGGRFPPRRGGEASMRPRVFPAEDSRWRCTSTRPKTCFNEAAGIPRGRHQRVTFPSAEEVLLQ